jgi:hypothetical protein
MNSTSQGFLFASCFLSPPCGANGLHSAQVVRVTTPDLDFAASFWPENSGVSHWGGRHFGRKKAQKAQKKEEIFERPLFCAF